ncbi:MAG TPA: tetratricopeptide repeat protein [Pirellulales bacterium]|nr:tetratricopeptide repeat protein [Pirellulales bacterium]
MATDIALQPLLAQFVSVHIDSTSDEWQKWERKFPSKSDSIPIVYLIRADGESLYAQSGSLPGPALPQLLAETLTKAGKLLNESQLKKIADGVAKANKSYDEGDVAEAVLQVTRYAGSGSYAEAAVAADALSEKLTEEAKQKIDAADQKLRDETTALEGAIELASVNRFYKKLPGIMKAVKETSAKYKSDAARREILAQADMIEQAKAFEQQRQPAKAAAVYQQAIDKYPGTAASELARAQLEVMGKSSGADGNRPSVGKKDASQNAKKAVSLLKMARVFAKGKPDKAKQFAEQVIELAPGTPQAEEAQSLIESLK